MVLQSQNSQEINTKKCTKNSISKSGNSKKEIDLYWKKLKKKKIK